MLIIKDGDEFNIELNESWLDFQPRAGTVLEIDLASSDYLNPQELWVGFYIVKSEIGGDGSSFLEAKYLGGLVGDLAKQFSTQFNKKVRHVHLCLQTLCQQPLDAQLHATRVRTWSVERFQADYMTANSQRQLRKWAGIPEPEGKKRGDPAQSRTSALRRKRPPGDGPGVRDSLPSALGGEEARPTAEVSRLRLKLDELRSKLKKGDQPVAEEGAELEHDAGDVEEVDSSSPDYSASIAPEVDPLETGTMLAKLDQPPKLGALAKVKSKKVKREVKEKRTSRKAKTPKHLGGSRGKERKGVETASLGLRDSTMKGMQNQLALRAAKVAEEKRERKRHSKRSSDRSLGKQLIDLLVAKRRGRGGREGGGSGRDSKEKKRKKKEKKKKRKGGGSDDSDSPMNGLTDSSGGSWDGGSESEESTSSGDKDLDPPLRKKARERPGSVLRMLLNHARTQLDQSSKVSLAATSDQDVTEGVKLASYFAICVRPTMGNNLGPIRELHHLSTAIDLLRQGDLTLLGDCLSSRFMAIHQAAVDGSWVAARHMELFPLEDTTAAASSVLLETRKHARLAAKVAGYDASSWKGAGRGKGGKYGKKGSWDGQEWQKGGKDGKKGKSTEKGGWQKKQPDTWKDSKETPGEKK